MRRVGPLVRRLGLVLRKDLRLSRLPLAGWLALLVVQAVVVLAGIHAVLPTDRARSLWTAAQTTIWLLHVSLLTVLVAGAIHADPPAAPTAFWPSRPLGRWTVLAAKLAFVVLAVAVPWHVANLVVVAGKGYPLEPWHRTADLLWLEVPILLPVVVLAALTTQLARTVLAIVGVVAFGTLLEFVLATVNPETASSRGRLEAAALVAIAAATVVGAATLVAAYRRRTRLAAVLVVAGLTLGVVLFNVWPWSFEKRAPALPSSVSLVPADLDEARDAWVMPKGAHGRERWTVFGMAKITGVPAGAQVWPESIESEVRSPDGRRYDSLLDTWFQSRPGRPQEMTIEGLGTVASLTGGAVWIAAVPTNADRPAGPVTAKARVWLLLFRDRVSARLPLRAGASWQDRTERIVVERVALEDVDTSSVELRESGVSERITSLFPRPDVPGSRSLWAFYNAGRGELLRSVFWPSSSQLLPPAARGLGIGRVQVRAEWPAGAPERAAREAWLRGAELVKLEETCVAQGERTIVVPGLQLPTIVKEPNARDDN